MKRIVIVLIAVLMPLSVWAANAQTGRAGAGTTNASYEGVTVDTDPGANGFWSEPVAASWGRDGEIYLEITAVNGTTFSLRYKAQGQSSYSIMPTTYTTVGNYKIDSNPATLWSVGIEDDNQGTAGAAQISW